MQDYQKHLDQCWLDAFNAVKECNIKALMKAAFSIKYYQNKMTINA